MLMMKINMKGLKCLHLNERGERREEDFFFMRRVRRIRERYTQLYDQEDLLGRARYEYKI